MFESNYSGTNRESVDDTSIFGVGALLLPLSVFSLFISLVLPVSFHTCALHGFACLTSCAVLIDAPLSGVLTFETFDK